MSVFEGKPWRTAPFTDPAANARAMITPGEKQLLDWLAREHFKGHGYIVDLGPFVGADTVIFGSALQQRGFQANPNDKPIKAYDLFDPMGENSTSDARFSSSESFFGEFMNNIRPYEAYVEVHKGDVTNESWDRTREIEILFNDISKTPDINAHIIRTFFPAMRPGHSVLIQQDYHDDHYWVPVTTEFLMDCFQQIDGPLGGTAAYLYVKELTPELIEAACTPDFERDRRLIQNVQRRHTGWYRRLFMICEARLCVDNGAFADADAILDKVEADYPNHAVLERRIKRTRTLRARRSSAAA